MYGPLIFVLDHILFLFSLKFYILHEIGNIHGKDNIKKGTWKFSEAKLQRETKIPHYL